MSRVGIFGASGSGKSTYVKGAIGKRARVVVFDPLQEYAAKTTAHTVDQVRSQMRADWTGFRIAFVPKAGQEPRALSQLCKFLITAQGRFIAGYSDKRLTLVVEEMNLAFPVHGGDDKCPGFAEVCSRGRHFGIDVFGVSQRIAEVGTRFRGNLSEIVILRQQGARDLNTAVQESGAAVQDVRALKNYQYLTVQGGDVRKGTVRRSR